MATSTWSPRGTGSCSLPDRRWALPDARPSAVTFGHWRGRGEPMVIAGRAALVTGGAAGIGAASARAREDAGGRVVTADRERAPISADLSRPGDATRMV